AAPHIGNTGINRTDDESARIWAAGYVVRDASRMSSNWRAEGDLVDWLAESGIVGISDVDTRALTRHLREAGSMRVGIFSGPAAADTTPARGGPAPRRPLPRTRRRGSRGGAAGPCAAPPPDARGQARR